MARPALARGQGTRVAAPESAPPTEAAGMAAQGGKRREKKGGYCPLSQHTAWLSQAVALPSLATLARPGESLEAAPAAMAGAGLGVAAGHPKSERERGEKGEGGGVRWWRRNHGR